MIPIINKKSTIIFIYFFIGIILIWFNRYSQRGDIVSYLSITDKYINCEFSDAINGVWSPLISWLLIPLIKLNLPVLIVFKFLNLVFGANIILIVLKMSEEQFKLKNSYIIPLITSLSFILFYFSLFLGSPDLLVALLLLLYLNLIAQKLYKTNSGYGIVIGLIGTLSYLAKAYAFPFFIMHFTITNLYFYKNQCDDRKNILINYTTGLLTFLFLSGIWITVLSFKYGFLTYSTASSYNFAMVGPEYNNIQSFRVERLYAPPNQSAISYWEDPTYLPYKKWNPFTSINNIFHLFSIVLKNLVTTFFLFAKFSPVFFFLIFIDKFKFNIGNDIFTVVLITIPVYLSGYLLLFVQDRFLIFPILLLIMLTFVLAASLKNRIYCFSKYYKVVLLILTLSIITKPLFSICKYWGEGKDLNKIKNYLQDNTVKGKFAAISNRPLELDWSNTIYLSYSTRSSFYGELPANSDITEIFDSIKTYKIDYLFDWRSNPVIDTNYFHQIAHFHFNENAELSLISPISSLIWKPDNNRIQSLNIYKVVK